ncbi:hypothetical protein SAMD00019534_004760 [Acytostelium subglobosum LB1]|uniref:hypothetical protein n=1 Tax=Acytostelium subglobosum LB1 TaxID=1410327 RepID=UPI000644E4FB|nr:hypothetical protein SAMD00019534_004760 [Acytostelium subglobosum LB1]GAM17301.1 hypothetical protein SAMD00019534_004760 [Acytostelium subglobosum LB1]|eukprot:XP_012759363.1 hypothetical protein SAMD00019534_004760 [Acytostelium subglobosum LB1]
MSSIRVVCRFRPQNKIELAQGGCSIVEVNDGLTVNIKGNEGANHSFTFDRIYTEKNSQKDVYDDAAKPVIEDIMQGYNGTIFVYGQTSSGKTHTMQGPSIDDPELKGVIPRMINTVFDCIKKADENIEFIVKASYIEIYMEKIRDLLDIRKDNLKVREEKAKGVWVEGTTEVYIYREDDILEVMRTGQANRAIASTNMNAESSRSHSIFILSIQQKNLKEGSLKNGKLYLVDLAGSEKVAKTGAQGLTLDEAKMINKSLSSLGNVINALTDGKSAHIPYRDSKLTRVLQESLGGNSRTTLIINCSPSSYNEVETISTLRFGSRAKNIKNKAKINQERSAAELKILLSKAEKEIESLKVYIKEIESVSGVASSRPGASGSAGSGDSGDLQTLKEKCIALEKQLFQKEEEKKELAEQLDSQIIQLKDKEQELETHIHHIATLKEESARTSQFVNESDFLLGQLSEMKIQLEQVNYDATEQSLLIEELTTENTTLKAQLEEAAKGQSSTVVTSSPMTVEDASLSVTKHNEEWTEMEAQIKMLQRTKLSAGTPASPRGSLSAPAVNLALQEENNGMKDKITDLESTVESLKAQLEAATAAAAAATAVAVRQSTEEHASAKQESDKPENASENLDQSETTNSASMEETPSEVMLQAEQMKKLLNENGDMKAALENLRSENKRLNAKTSSIEQEMKARMEEDLNTIREQTSQKLKAFGVMKEALLSDLEARCQQVIDYDFLLAEFKDRNATLSERLKRAAKMNADDQDANSVQSKLDEMTSIKQQLSIEISKLRLDAQRASKQMSLKTEHILSLENALQETQAQLNKQSVELLRYKTMSTEHKKSAPESGARIVRPIRGGTSSSGNTTTPIASEQTPVKLMGGSSTSAPTYSTPKSSSSLTTSSAHNGSPSMSSSTTGSPSTPPTHSANKAPAVAAANSESTGLWGGIFGKKKQTTPAPTTTANNNIVNTPSTPPPIPISLNSYAPAVPNSPATSSSQQQ